MASDIRLSLLDQVEIASPCSARWEDMAGDDRSRHCAECNLDVYNLSAMSRDAAESFLSERLGAGRVCVQLYRRSDGTILTQDCPVGLAAIRARARRTAVRVAAAIVALVSATVFAQWRGSEHEAYPFSVKAGVRDFGVMSRLCDWMRSTTAPRATRGAMIMGSIAPPRMRSWNETLTNHPDEHQGRFDYR